MKVLFAGLGGIGQRHLRLLREIVGPSLEVHAYRTRKQQIVLSKTLEVESQTGLDDVYSVVTHETLDSGLAIRPDVLFVTNPTSMHYSTALAAIESRIPVFIEKPIADDFAAAKRLADRAISLGVKGMVGYQLRFHPLVQLLLELIGDQRIGRVISARFQVGEFLPNWHRYEDYRQMYASRRELGGGVVRTQIHEIDLIFALFGIPEYVYSVGGQLSDLEVDVEDTVLSLFHFLIDGRVVPVSLSQDYVQIPPKRQIEVVGAAGRIEVDLIHQSLRMFSEDGELVIDRIESDFQRDDLFRAQLRSLIEYLKGDSPPPVTLSAGAVSLAIAESCLRSLETNEVEKVLA